MFAWNSILFQNTSMHLLYMSYKFNENCIGTFCCYIPLWMSVIYPSSLCASKVCTCDFIERRDSPWNVETNEKKEKYLLWVLLSFSIIFCLSTNLIICFAYMRFKIVYLIYFSISNFNFICVVSLIKALEVETKWMDEARSLQALLWLRRKLALSDSENGGRYFFF